MHSDAVVLRLVEEDTIIFDDEDRRRGKQPNRNLRDVLDRDDDDEEEDEDDEVAGRLTDAVITARAVKAAR